MTDTIAIKVDVFPDEFRPIMKALRFALSSNEFVEYVLDNDKSKVELLEFFLDDFSTVALNEAL
jgi:hypothetical protein